MTYIHVWQETVKQHERGLHVPSVRLTQMWKDPKPIISNCIFFHTGTMAFLHLCQFSLRQYTNIESYRHCTYILESFHVSPVCQSCAVQMMPGSRTFSGNGPFYPYVYTYTYVCTMRIYIYNANRHIHKYIHRYIIYIIIYDRQIDICVLYYIIFYYIKGF